MRDKSNDRLVVAGGCIMIGGLLAVIGAGFTWGFSGFVTMFGVLLFVCGVADDCL